MLVNQQKCVNCAFLVNGICEIHQHEISFIDSLYEWCAEWKDGIKEDDRLCDDSKGTWLPTP